ncbi:hypothetical protein QQF64_015361 [Cirrhinus molitorella]|uniref:C-C motif chemokine n=1 Tax=Cirrhinus molitorella TaxID=172907 RepID=A0ABR3NVZ2_9TELE
MTLTSLRVIVLLVAALSVLCTDASALSCCRKFTKRQIPLSLIRGFSVQTITLNCHTNAVIFHTRKGKNICADSSKTWVKDIMRNIRVKIEKLAKNQFATTSILPLQMDQRRSAETTETFLLDGPSKTTGDLFITLYDD